MPESEPDIPTLPSGHRFRQLLGRRSGETVVLTDTDAGSRVVRLLTGTELAGSAGEVALAGRVVSEHLAAVVEAGTRPDGGVFVVREWVDGRSLAGVGPLDEADVAELAHGIALGLGDLHRAGFVHGDVKPANVIQRPGGDAVVTDFGLASARGSSSGGATAPSGTAGYIAPETLLRAEVTPRSDLFSLGVTMLELLGADLPPPAELYGRFPAQPLLEVTGTRIEERHPRLGPLVAELLESDPRRRPATADEVAQRLAGAFDLDGGPTSAPVCPPWSHWRGREALLQSALEAPGEIDQDWRAATDAEATALAEEAALTMWLQGRACVHVDLDRDLAEVGESVALDRWLAHLERRPAEELLILSGTGGSWARKLPAVIEGLRHSRPAVWIAASHPRRAVDIPPPGQDAIEVEIARALPGEAAEARREVATALVTRAREGSVALERRFAALFDGRSVIQGPGGARLAPGTAPDKALRAQDRRREEVLRSLSAKAARWLALASACRESRGPAFEIMAARCDPAIRRELQDAGLVAVESTAAGPRLEPLARVGALELGLPRAARRELHGEAVARLESAGSPPEAKWPWMLLAHGDGAVQGIARDAAALCVDGTPERAAWGLASTTKVLAREAEPMPRELTIEHARALARAGDLGGAEALLPEGVGADAPDVLHVRALCSRARGDSHDAVQLFEAAGWPDAAEEERIHAAFQDNDLDGVERRATALLARDGDVAYESRVNVATIAMVAAARRGDAERLAVWMETLDGAVGAAAPPLVKARAALNRGTVLRDAGRLQEAAVALDAAATSFAEAGQAMPLAQARLALSAVLRDLWQLGRAEELAEQTLGSRRRLGDRVGADIALGMRGLARLERGHLSTARLDLDAASRALRAAGQVRNASHLAARAREAAARLGGAASFESAPTEHDGPRELVARWRTAACSAKGERADVGLLRRAIDAARTAGPRTTLREAEWLLDRVDGPGRLAPTTFAEEVEAAIEGAASMEHLRTLLERAVDGGADAHAARLALALSARGPAGADLAHPRAALRTALQSMFGADAAPSHPVRHLLGRPDPAPADLEALDEARDEDMDVKTILSFNKRLVEQEGLDTLLGAIVDAALEVTGGERGFLMLEEAGELVLDRALDSSRGDLDAEEVEYSSSIVREALRVGECLRLADAKDDVLFSGARSVSRLELRSVIAQPFQVEQGLRGVIVVDDRRRVGQFGDREASLIGLLAEQAALAVRQVRRLDKIRSLRDELAERVVDREERLEVLERRLEETGETPRVEGLVGDSEAMGQVHLLLRRVAGSDIPVLVTGESGTGKELAARAVHSLSPRSGGPFITANCAAFPDSLIESELFGARKGAYTGANEDRAGLFERADGGTLFLDEIGELPLAQQAKLLRVLETRQVRRVGDDRERDVDFRLVVATNRDLAAAVEAGTFREDLVYRLNAVSVHMPPLAERAGDIPLLVQHFLRIAETRDGQPRTVTPEVLRALVERPWPGNVRELANEVARLVLLSDGRIEDPALVRAPGAAPSSVPGGLVRSMRDIERDAIMATLASVDGDKRRAAEILGISRAKIYQRLKEWGE